MKGLFIGARILQVSAIYSFMAISRGQGVPIEKQLHLLERFESDWCTAPLMSSPPPYFTFNGIRLNDDDINAQYGTMVNRSTSLQGHHQAKLVIARVKPSVNGSIIACWINSDVLLEYHLTIVEPQGMEVIGNGLFQSGLCESPQVPSQAPYFTCTLDNGITVEFNNASINDRYNANVSRSYSPKGHRQASLTILGTNSMMNNALITCWENSTTIILQYRLMIIDSEASMNPTIAAVTAAANSIGYNTYYTSDATDAHDVVANISESKTSYLSQKLQIALPIAVTVILLLIAIIVGCIIVVAVHTKRAKSRQESISTDPEYALVSLNGSLSETSPSSAIPKGTEN